MRDRLVELLQNFADVTVTGNGTIVDRTKVEDVADFLLANGVIVLPCKVGDIVYQADRARTYELTILDISLHKNKPYYETDEIDFDDDAIGKSIFLTREEAEKALSAELEAARKAAKDAESARLTAELVAKRAEERLEEAQKKLKTASPEVTAFKALFDSMQDTADKLKRQIEKIHESDPETADKLTAALRSFGSSLGGNT